MGYSRRLFLGTAVAGLASVLARPAFPRSAETLEGRIAAGLLRRAAFRAIVVHGAWYVSDQMVAHSGMLGRSEGCFAVDQCCLDQILSRLGPGRLIYADRA